VDEQGAAGEGAEESGDAEGGRHRRGSHGRVGGYLWSVAGGGAAADRECNAGGPTTPAPPHPRPHARAVRARRQRQF
jgi:hypothetical protein